MFASRLALSEAGGVESAVCELVPALAAYRSDWNVSCVHAYGRRTRSNTIPFLGDLVAGIVIALRCRGADAVVINGGEYAWPRVLGRRARAATAVVWHGTRAGEIPALRPRLSFSVRTYLRLEIWLQRFALLARSQIAVSETTRAELQATYGTRRAIAMIPNGAPLGARDRREDAGRERYRVAWIGTTAYKKGLDLAIAACRIARVRQPELRLAVIGREADAKESRASETWIDYLGRIDRTATLEELRRCSIFLGTSRYEGCSVAIIEALALGLPVVAAPSVAWMIGRAGIPVADYEPSSFASALEQLLSEGDLGRSYAGRTREAALAFDWGHAAQAYAREIETCLERPRARAGGRPNGCS